LLIAHQVDLCCVAATFDASGILAGFQFSAALRIFQRLRLVIAGRIALQQLAGIEIDQTRCDAFSEELRHILGAHFALHQARYCQNVTLLVEGALLLLARLKPYRRACHHDGTDQTQYDDHHQRLADAVIIFHLSHAPSSV